LNSPHGPAFLVRDAHPTDLDTIAEFNTRLAAETEGKPLDARTIRAGVFAALADPTRLRYWVAERTPGGPVVGQAAVSREWSDWRNGWLWWFQSVYVHPEARGQGVFRLLHAQIRTSALAEPDVVGLRLYVEHNNARARSTYEALGMVSSGHEVYEEVWGLPGS
jgi:GNAT superfamily N-acetyltransferase